MAVSFNGTSDYIDVTGVAALATPTGAVSLSAWVYRSGVQSTNDRIAQKEHNNAATAPYVSYGLEFSSSNVLWEIGLSTGGVDGLHQTSAVTLDDVTWTHFVGTFDRTLGSSRLRLYKNGASAVTATGADQDILHNGSHFSLGARNTAGNRSAISLAEVAVWNAPLDAGEAAALALGLSPIGVRPGSLVYYSPLIRGYQDRINAAVATVNGTTAVSHPHVFYPRKTRAIFVPAAGGGFQAAWAHVASKTPVIGTGAF